MTLKLLSLNVIIILFDSKREKCYILYFRVIGHCILDTVSLSVTHLYKWVHATSHPYLYTWCKITGLGADDKKWSVQGIPADTEQI